MNFIESKHLFFCFFCFSNISSSSFGFYLQNKHNSERKTYCLILLHELVTLILPKEILTKYAKH